MVLLFPSRNRERLLVGQLLFLRRPESSKRSQWWGRREGRKGGWERKEAESCADHISFFTTATLCPAGAHGEGH